MLFCYLGDHRQGRERGVPGTGENGHKPGHQRGEKGNVFGVTAQQALRQANQVVHPPGHLHRGNRSDHRHDDLDNVKGDRARLDLEKERQDEHAKPTGKADADPAESGT